MFRAGAGRLVRVLDEADPAAPVWTWAPSQQDAGFVIRHQVQEAVGHHWDVAHAAGRTIRISPAVGADAVDEFLHFSVSNADDAAGEDPLPHLEGRLGLACEDSVAAWLVADGALPGTASVSRTAKASLDADGVPTVGGPAASSCSGSTTATATRRGTRTRAPSIRACCTAFGGCASRTDP